MSVSLKKWKFALITLFLLLSLSYSQTNENPIRATDVEFNIIKDPSNPNKITIKASVLAYATYENEDRTGVPTGGGDKPVTKGKAKIYVEYLDNAEINVYAQIGGNTENACTIITNKVEQVDSIIFSDSRLSSQPTATMTKYYGECTVDLSALSKRLNAPCFLLAASFQTTERGDILYKSSKSTTSICGGNSVNPLIGVINKAVEDEIRNDPNPFCIPSLILFGLLVASLHTRGFTLFGILDVLMPKPPSTPSYKYSYANFSPHSSLKNEVKKAVRRMELFILPTAFTRLTSLSARSLTPREMLIEIARRLGMRNHEINTILSSGGESALIREIRMRLGSLSSEKERQETLATLNLFENYFALKATSEAYEGRKKLVGPFKLVNNLLTPSFEKSVKNVKNRKLRMIAFSVDNLVGRITEMPLHGFKDSIWGIQQGVRTFLFSQVWPVYFFKGGRKAINEARMNLERVVEGDSGKLKKNAAKFAQFVIGENPSVDSIVNLEEHNGYYALRYMQHVADGYLGVAITELIFGKLDVFKRYLVARKRLEGELNKIEGIAKDILREKNFYKSKEMYEYSIPDREGAEEILRIVTEIKERLNKGEPIDLSLIEKVSRIEAQQISDYSKDENDKKIRTVDWLVDTLLEYSSLSREELHNIVSEVSLSKEEINVLYEIKEKDKGLYDLLSSNASRDEIVQYLGSLNASSPNSQMRGGEDPLEFINVAQRWRNFLEVLSHDSDFRKSLETISRASAEIHILFEGGERDGLIPNDLYNREKGAYEEHVNIYSEERRGTLRGTSEVEDLRLIEDVSSTLRRILGDVDSEVSRYSHGSPTYSVIREIFNNTFETLETGYDETKVLDTISERFVNVLIRSRDIIENSKREGMELPIFKDREHLMRGAPSKFFELYKDPTYLSFIYGTVDKMKKGINREDFTIRDYFDLHLLELANFRFGFFDKEMIEPLDSAALNFLDDRSMNGKQRLMLYSEFMKSVVNDLRRDSSYFSFRELSSNFLRLENLDLNFKIISTPFEKNTFGKFKPTSEQNVYRFVSQGSAVERSDYNSVIRQVSLWQFLANRYKGQYELGYKEGLGREPSLNYSSYVSGRDIALLQHNSDNLLIDGSTHFNALPGIYNSVRIYSLSLLGVNINNPEEVQNALDIYSFKEGYNLLKENGFKIYKEDLQKASFYNTKELGMVPVFFYEAFDRNVLPYYFDRELESYRNSLLKETSSLYIEGTQGNYIESSIRDFELERARKSGLLSNYISQSAYPVNISSYVFENGRLVKAILEPLLQSQQTLQELTIHGGTELRNALAERASNMAMRLLEENKREDVIRQIVNLFLTVDEVVAGVSKKAIGSHFKFHESFLRRLASTLGAGSANELLNLININPNELGLTTPPSNMQDLSEALISSRENTRLFVERFMEHVLNGRDRASLERLLSLLGTRELLATTEGFFSLGGGDLEIRRELSSILSYLEDNGFNLAAAKYAYQIAKDLGDDSFLKNLRNFHMGTKPYISERLSNYERNLYTMTGKYNSSSMFAIGLIKSSMIENLLAYSGIKLGRLSLGLSESLGSFLTELEWTIYGNELLAEERIFHTTEMAKATGVNILLNATNSEHYRNFLKDIDSSKGFFGKIKSLMYDPFEVRLNYLSELLIDASTITREMGLNYGALDPSKRDGKIAASFHVKSSLMDESMFSSLGLLGYANPLSEHSPLSSSLYMATYTLPLTALFLGGLPALLTSVGIGLFGSGAFQRGVGRYLYRRTEKDSYKRFSVFLMKSTPHHLVSSLAVKSFYFLFKPAILSLAGHQRHSMFPSFADVVAKGAGDRDVDLPKRISRTEISRTEESIKDLYYKLSIYSLPVLSSALLYFGNPIGALSTIALGSAYLMNKLYTKRRGESRGRAISLTERIAKKTIPTEHLTATSHDEIKYRTAPTLFEYSSFYSHRIGLMGGLPVNPGQSYVDFYSGQYRTENWIERFLHTKPLLQKATSSLNPSEIGRIYDMFSRYNTLSTVKALESWRDVYGYNPSYSYIWWTLAPGLLAKWLFTRMREQSAQYNFFKNTMGTVYSYSKRPLREIRKRSLSTILFGMTIPAVLSNTVSFGTVLAGAIGVGTYNRYAPSLSYSKERLIERTKRIAEYAVNKAQEIKEKFDDYTPYLKNAISPHEEARRRGISPSSVRREAIREAVDLARKRHEDKILREGPLPKRLLNKAKKGAAVIGGVAKEFITPPVSYYRNVPYPYLNTNRCARCGSVKPLTGICPVCHYSRGMKAFRGRAIFSFIKRKPRRP